MVWVCCVAAKLVPKELNCKKGTALLIAKDMISKAESDPTFTSNVSLLETWVYEYDTQSRHQASEWKASKPRPKKCRFQSKKKAMLTVFMNYNGIVHHKFLPESQTVNKEYYLGVMRRLREAVRQKRKDL